MKHFEKRGDPAVLRAEVEGLAAIAATNTVRVPQVIELRGDVLVLERLEFAPPDADFGRRFGRALAALHDHPCSGPFGWASPNFIGATPQVNTPSDDWLGFWRDARLLPMLDRLPGANELRAAVRAVIDSMPLLFDDGYTPMPCLVHGDLWPGNWGVLRDGTPVVFDPCVSYDDRETDLAMMELFGSPPPGFADGYGKPARGYARRKRLYQLYHLLNHAVLFGGRYGRQALDCARELA